MDPLLEIAFSDPAIDDIVSRAIEGHGSYYRLQVDLGTPPIDLDNSSPAALQRLESSTELFMKEHSSEMDQLVSELRFPRSPNCGPRVGADYERPEGPRLRRPAK